MAAKELFFDFETSGLPGHRQSSDLKHSPECYPVELGAIFDHEGGRVQILSNVLDWTPVAVESHPKALAVHGITSAAMRESGIMQETVFDSFFNLLCKADLLVAHNFAFDFQILCIWARRIGQYPALYAALDGKPYFCTKEAGTALCRIPSPNGFGGWKWPTLAELHQFLFGKGFDGAHAAFFDIRATRSCYKEMRKRGCEGEKRIVFGEPPVNPYPAPVPEGAAK